MKKILLILLLLMIPILVSCKDENVNEEYKKNHEALSKLYEEVDEKILCYKLKYYFTNVSIDTTGEMRVKIKYTNSFVASEIIEFDFVNNRCVIFDNEIYENLQFQIKYKDGLYEHTEYFFSTYFYNPHSGKPEQELFGKKVKYFQDDRKIYFKFNFDETQKYEIDTKDNITLSLVEWFDCFEYIDYIISYNNCEIVFNNENEIQFVNRGYYGFTCNKRLVITKCEDFNVDITPTEFSEEEKDLVNTINTDFKILGQDNYQTIVYEKEDLRNKIEVLNAKKN